MVLLSGIGILLVLIGICIGFLGGALFNNWHFSFMTGMSSSTPSSSSSSSTTTVSSSVTNASTSDSSLEPGLSSSVPPMITASDASTTEPAEYTDVSSWQIADATQETQAGFTMMYPGSFTLDQGSVSQTTDWRADSQDPGIAVLSITVPPSLDPETNFVGATVTAGYSKDASALSNCFIAPNGDSVSTSSASVNGIKFVVYTAESVGAGQQYTTTSYRTTHSGACYAVEYTIHSTNLSNFPAGDNYTAYDSAEITDILNRVVGTFSFL
jgi:hypothetical protein